MNFCRFSNLKKMTVNQVNASRFEMCEELAQWCSGSVRASHPDVPGSNLDALEKFLTQFRALCTKKGIALNN